MSHEPIASGGKESSRIREWEGGKMKPEVRIRQMIHELKSDQRYKQKPALVQINAPLALIQTSIEGKIEALEWVLKK